MAKAPQQSLQKTHENNRQQKLRSRDHNPLKATQQKNSKNCTPENTAKAMQEKPPHSKNHTEQHTTKAAQQRTAHNKVIQWGTPHRKSHTIENTSFVTHSKSCTREGGSTQ